MQVKDAPAAPETATAKPQGPSRLPGVAICLAIALVAVFLGTHAPIVGAPVFALVLGIIIGNLRRPTAAMRPGITWCGKKVLQYAIILLGGGLSIAQVVRVGRESLAVMLLTLAASLIAAAILGRVFGVDRKLTTLVGVGTGICGGSAIAAVAPIVEADDDAIAFSISTVFLFNLAAVLVFPLVGHALQLGQQGFGIWAGTAINDTSSVVAAGYSYGKEAGDIAAITKMARTTMIIPIALAISLLESRRRQAGGKVRLAKIMPWFVLGFLLLSIVSSTGILGATLPALLGKGGKYAIVIALAGVGLGADLGKIIKTGFRPVLLGLCVWAIVAGTSLLIQSFTGQLHQ